MKRVILLSLSILLISLAYSFAEVPCKINYQGRLIKDNVPVDGTKTMRFSIYDSAVGPTQLWTSGDVNVEVHNGLFRYVIGSGGTDLSGMDWTAGQALYLEVVIDGETLTPREELSAYPYAINSHLLEGKAKEYFLDTSGDAQTKQGDLNIMGNVGIGTASPRPWGVLTLADNLVFSEQDKDYFITGPANGGAIRLRSDGDGANRYINLGQMDNNKVFSPHLTVANGGNVGIGTTDPDTTLEVNGTFRATGGIKPDWVSEWFNVGVRNSYKRTHNLGTKDYTILILYRKDASATYYNIANHYEQPFRNTWNGGSTGACVLEQGDNYILIRTGTLYVNGIGLTDLDSKYYQTSGQYRILLWKF